MAVSAEEAVAPASELAATCSEIAELQWVLGKKTLENDNVEGSDGVRSREKAACALALAAGGRPVMAVLPSTRADALERLCAAKPIDFMD